MRPSAPSPNVDAAVGECFQAALEPELWPDAMDSLATSLGLVGCCFNTKGPQSRMKLPASSRYRDMLRDFLSEGWPAQDLRAHRGWRLVEAGQRVVTEDDISTAEERASLPFYQDFLKPRDMATFVGVGLKIGGQAWSFSGAVPSLDGTVDRNQVAMLGRLQPHLARMLRLAQASQRKSEAGVLQAFELAGQAAMLVDCRGGVTDLNERARLLLGVSLDIRDGRLAATDPSSNAALQSLIAAATTTETNWSSAALDPIVIKRNDTLPIVVEAVPAREAIADGFGFSGALLMLTDPDRDDRRSEHLMSAVLGLTKREAQVAALLFAGASAIAIAAKLGLRVTSVRQMIKHILAKTGATAKSELVALLARLPTPRP